MWLQPGQKRNQNLNQGNLLGQQRYHHLKEDGLVLSHQSKISIRTISRKKLSIFFDIIRRLYREEDGAIQFCRIKFHLRDHHSQIQNWSDDRWKACLAAGGGSKRRHQYCSDNLETILYLRALQGHSGRNLIDHTLQEYVLTGLGILPYIYHVGSTFNLDLIVSNGLVPGGQNLSRKQTVFFLLVEPRNENHTGTEFIDFSVPRLAQSMHKAWKRHQDAVFWVDIDLGIKEGLIFYQTRSNAIILQGTLPANCIVKVERLKTGEKCENLARIGRLDIRWSANKLARSITKWTKVCDKRLNRLISYIHVGNTAKQCRLGLFQDSDFAGDLEDSKSISGGTLCVFGSQTFVPISWICKKQTAVSHSSTESEIIWTD